MLNIFHVVIHHLYLLISERSVCVFSLFSNWPFFLFYSWILQVLWVCFIYYSFVTHVICKYSFPVCSLSFHHFNMIFHRGNVFNFDEVCWSISFSIYVLCFCVKSKSSLPSPRPRSSLMFIPKICYSLTFYIKSVIRF